jgi:A118 family predicted phage portal protein
MPLPRDGSLWPPQHLAPMYSKMSEWGAWYSGEPTRIIDVYANGESSGTGVPWWRFWSRARAARDGAQRAMLHVPVAGDLASTSAALIFGEMPRIRIKPAHELEEEQSALEEQKIKKAATTPLDPFDPQARADAAAADAEAKAAEAEKAAKPKPETPESKAEARLLDILEQGDFYARLVEAAESAAAIGGVYIYPVWDKDLRPFPLLGIAQSDQAIPEFQFGILKRVTFYRVVEKDGNTLWRHIEVHEVEGTGETRKAVVLHGLYKGSDNDLGIAATLGAQGMTANLEPRVELPFQELDVEYVPNIRPNRLFRGSALGVADIQGAETLLDALDETYASWMRDIRLAKARIIVPREYLRFDGDDPNGVPALDIDQEVYVGMDMDPGLTQDARAMLAHQFEIRYLEHRETAKDLVDRIVSNAGYTPATFGVSDPAAGATGAALRVSEHKTILTLKRKSTFWRTAIANVLYRMQLVDKEVFKSGIEAFRPSVTTADSIIDNPLELAQTALALKTAEASSVETRVRIVHPEWSESEIDAEVARIEGEKETAPSPLASAPPQPFGDDSSDPASGVSKKPITDK